jgi:hypothetical protein
MLALINLSINSGASVVLVVIVVFILNGIQLDVAGNTLVQIFVLDGTLNLKSRRKLN